MSETLTVRKVNEVWLKISCSDSVKRELWEHFSYFAPSYKWNKKFKLKLWDGKIHMFDLRSSTIYVGLMRNIAIFCRDRNYKIDCDFSPTENSLSEVEFDEFLKEINVTMPPRDYQRKTVIKSIRRKRATFLSPTASGKSYIIYLILRYLNVKSLLIVPTTNLVMQMRNDFKEYAENDDWDIEDETSIIMSGYSKSNLNQIVISTWQSLQDMPSEWFHDNEFDCIILDEAHGGKAVSIKSIMEKNLSAEYRFGFTGTLDDVQINELLISGLFGPVHQVVETKELIDNKTLSDLEIKCITFHYSKETKKKYFTDLKLALEEKKEKSPRQNSAAFVYNHEVEFLLSQEKRNKFVGNLALSLKGNSLILFNRVEAHGKVLYDMLKDNDKGKKVFFIAGEVNAKIREEIRKTVDENKKDCIIIGSQGTVSTGVNIVNLHNIILAASTKSKIKVLQTIGRGLRRGSEKENCTFYDLSDDLSSKTKNNYTYQHAMERMKLYIKSGFKYKNYDVELEQ